MVIIKSKINVVLNPEKGSLSAVTNFMIKSSAINTIITGSVQVNEINLLLVTCWVIVCWYVISIVSDGQKQTENRKITKMMLKTLDFHQTCPVVFIGYIKSQVESIPT